MAGPAWTHLPHNPWAGGTTAGCICSFPSHILDFKTDLRASEGVNSVMTRLRLPKWQFQFILLKHLRASCCSDRSSSVPDGNVSDPGKTEVLGEQRISLNRKKMYFKVLEPWALILARILWDPGVQKRSIIKDKLGISDTTKWKVSYFYWIKKLSFVTKH